MRLEQASPKAPQSPTHPASNGSSNGALSPILSLKASNGATNGHGKTESNGSYSNGTHVVADSETWQGHNKKEVTRMLIQSLSDLGFPSAAKQLSKESGLELERPHVAAFRQAVLEGEWAEAESILFGPPNDGAGDTQAIEDGGAVTAFDDVRKSTRNAWTPQRQGLPLAGNANESQMRFWIRQQKYLELLEKRDLGGALNTLRSELTPLNFDMPRLHQLSR